MTYPACYRKKVLAYKNGHNLSVRETAKYFKIGINSVVRWEKKPEPAKTKSRPSIKISAEALQKDVEDYPDDFLYERARRFRVTAVGIHLALKRLKLSRKKTLKHPNASEELRASFQHRIAQYEKEGRAVAYLDESGFAVDTPRTHGYSLIGARLYGSCDWHSRGRINVIGACIDMTFINVVLFDGNIDSNVFYAWVISELLPVPPGSSVFVLDNAAFHKRQDIKNAIVKAGHTLEYLPPYSPDLNPIEHKWAQAKSIRKKERCNVDDLFRHHLTM